MVSTAPIDVISQFGGPVGCGSCEDVSHRQHLAGGGWAAGPVAARFFMSVSQGVGKLLVLDQCVVMKWEHG